MVLDMADLAAVQVGAVAEDDAGVTMVDSVTCVSGILQGIEGHLEGEELVRLTAIHRVGHDAELARVEAVQVVQVAAVLGVDAPRVEVALRLPFLLRLADGIKAGQDIAPEAGQVRSLREDAGHADDGDRRVAHHSVSLRRWVPPRRLRRASTMHCRSSISSSRRPSSSLKNTLARTCWASPGRHWKSMWKRSGSCST